MSDYNLQLTAHPSVARHPTTNQPLEKDGVPVPLLPDFRAIRLDGRIIGYVNHRGQIAYKVPKANIPAAILDEVDAMVATEYGLAEAGSKSFTVEVPGTGEDDSEDDD